MSAGTLRGDFIVVLLYESLKGISLSARHKKGVYATVMMKHVRLLAALLMTASTIGAVGMVQAPAAAQVYGGIGIRIGPPPPRYETYPGSTARLCMAARVLALEW